MPRGVKRSSVPVTSDLAREAGERAAAADRGEARAEARRRAAPGEVAERRASRTGFADEDSPREASRLAEREFGEVFDDAEGGLGQIEDEFGDVVSFLSDYSVRVDRGRNDAVAVSSLPLRREVKGKRRPVDLSLQRTKRGLEPETPLVAVTLPAKLSDGFVVGRGNVRFSITGAAPSDAPALIAEDQRAVYAEALPATDVILAPSTLGASLAFQLKGRQSPEAFRVVADLPRGATLRGVGKSEESAEVVKGSQRLALIGAPRTVDADGRPVPTTMEVVGGTIEIRVNHRDSDLRYPLLTDPEVWDDYRDASGRSWYQGGAMAPTSGRAGPNDKPADWFFHDFLNGWFIPATSCSPAYPDSCFGTGIGLHVYMYPGGNYYRNPYPNGKRAYGEWVYTIPGYNFDNPQAPEPSTYIAAASFQYQTLSCRGSNQALPYITEGIYAPYNSTGYGNWTGFTNIICGAANQPTTYTSTPGQNSAYVANPKPPPEQGKVAAFSLSLDGPRSTQVDAYLGGAIMVLQDREAPTIQAPSLLAWDKDRLAEVTATDAGLGMKEIRIEAPGLETQVEKTECSGTRSARPAENEPAGRCPRSLTAELTTDGLKDGIDTVTVTATDVTGKSSSRAVSVRTDRIVPQVNFSGSLSTARVLTDPSYSLSVAAQDAGAGTASGMRRVEIYVDGKLKAQQDATCPGECPPGASASLEFASDSYPDGYHDVATRTVDEAGNDSWDGFRVLVARNGPLARATGELLTYADEALSSPEPLELEVGGADQLVGVKSIGLARIVPGRPDVTVASQDSGCTVVICPKGRAATFQIDTAALPEGRQTLRAFSINALDQRTTSASWTVTVDRTPPAVPGEPTLRDEDDPVQVSVAPGIDPALPDGSPGSGVASIEYRYREDDGTLSEWEDIEVGQPLEVYRDPGESLALEYRAVDWANNRSASRNRTITMPGAEEEPTGGGPPDTTSRQTAFAAEGGEVDFPQQCLPAGETMIWTGPPPFTGFQAFDGSGGDRTDSVDSKTQSQKNLPDCRELPIASPTVPSVQDATPVVPAKKLGKYDLKAPTAYSAFRLLKRPFDPEDRDFHPLYDSLGNKFARLQQPKVAGGPWTVANEAGNAGRACPVRCRS